MPEFTAIDRNVLDYVAEWYGAHRGALSAHQVAEATGLPCAQVSASAGVLAAAGRVRTYRSPRLHDDDREVLFVGLVGTTPRVVDLTTLSARGSWRCGPQPEPVARRA